MDKTTFQCPACKKVHFARPEMSGERFRCTCGQTLIAPEVDASAMARPYDLVPEWVPEGGKKPKHVTKVAVPKPMPQEEQSATTGEDVAAYDGRPRKKKDSTTDKWGPVRAREEQAYFDREAEFQKAAGRSAAMWWSIVIGVFLVLALGLMWSIMRPRSLSSSGYSGPPRGDDAQVAGLTSAWGATELGEWLKPGGVNHVDGLKDDEARAVAKKWYDMGAVKVLAFGTGTVDELAIELPEDTAKRAAIFEWDKRFMEANHKDGHKDEGQQYLLIKIKP